MSAETVMLRDPQLVALTNALAAPFEPREVKFKPQMVKNNRCLAMAYIDARLVQERLDDVLGAENWEDIYKQLPDGSVMCKLRIKLGDRWVTKMDVGSPSEQPDQGDRLKAAVSDALKRTAVKFGIGRYLYRLSAQWVDYDPIKKQIVQVPQMPAFAIPKKPAAPAKSQAAPTPSGFVAAESKKETARTEAPKIDAPKPAAAKAEPPTATTASEQPKQEAPKAANLPSNGQELHRRLREYDAKLAAQKLCPVGALLAHVTQAGVKAGYTANMSEWNGPAIQFAVDAVREFDQTARQGKPEPRTAA